MIHLKEIREAKGVSVKRLAELTDLSPAVIWSYEAGRRDPPLVSLIAIADALDVSLDRLVWGKEKEPRPEDRAKLEYVTAEAFSNLSPDAREIAEAVLAVLSALQE